MLIVRKNHLEEIARHGEESYPRECCGCLLGTQTDGQWKVTRVMPARNLLEGAKGADRYQMDPADRFRAEKEAQRSNEAIVGFYHSHPDHDVYFSQTDVENSEEYLLGEPWLPPTYAYIVMSIQDGKRTGEGAFNVRDGKGVPLELQVDEA